MGRRSEVGSTNGEFTVPIPSDLMKRAAFIKRMSIPDICRQLATIYTQAWTEGYEAGGGAFEEYTVVMNEEDIQRSPVSEEKYDNEGQSS